MKHILCFGWLMMVRYGGVDTRRAESPRATCVAAALTQV